MFSAILRRLTPNSIRTQLTLWYLLTLGAALAAFAVFVLFARASTLLRELDADLSVHANQLLDVVQPALLRLDVEEALRSDERFADDAIAVRERSGALIFRSPAFPQLGAAGENMAAEAVRDAAPLATIQALDGLSYRLATVIATRPGAAPLVLQVAAPTQPVWGTLRQLAMAMLMFYVLVMAVASYGGSFIARRALRPVDAIVGRVRTIKATHLGERLEMATGSEELERLVTTLNEMLDGIDASMRSARRFASDASHELQTPIAAMRMVIESSLRDTTGAATGEIAGDLLEEIERLSALVRDLRLLALTDAGHLVGRLEATNLAGIVDSACDVIGVVAEPRDIAIVRDGAAEVPVAADVLHLRRAILNLLHNAVRYSSDHAAVHVTVDARQGEATVTIADEGCGIPAADLPHIFERFYRADPARSRDSGGTGLGLAIADQIVRLHGGRIDVTSESGKGSTFILRVPALASAPVALPASAID